MCVSLIFSFPAGGGRGQTGCRPSGSLRPLSAGKEESPLRVPAAARCAVPALVLLQRLPVPRIFIFKSIRCPAAGSIINKRPARIKRGRLRNKDSFKVFYTLTFLDSLQAIVFQCLQQSACIKKSLQRIKKSLQAYQKVAAKTSNYNSNPVLFH